MLKENKHLYAAERNQQTPKRLAFTALLQLGFLESTVQSATVNYFHFITILCFIGVGKVLVKVDHRQTIISVHD